MLLKTIFLYAGLAAAHAAINPALGLTKNAVRSDVQRPSTQKPCGNANLAAIDTSTAVAANANGQFTTTIQNFNGGTDGSRQVSLTVDSTGKGTSFKAGTVTQNGVAAPATTGTQQIVAQLPAGTKCTGGAAGNLCLASFKTLGGFGNCVVVSQGAGTQKAKRAPEMGMGALEGLERRVAVWGSRLARYVVKMDEGIELVE